MKATLWAAAAMAVGGVLTLISAAPAAPPGAGPQTGPRAIFIQTNGTPRIGLSTNGLPGGGRILRNGPGGTNTVLLWTDTPTASRPTGGAAAAPAPGVYLAKPWSLLVGVPDPGCDPGFTHAPGDNAVPMPTTTPELDLVPLPSPAGK